MMRRWNAALCCVLISSSPQSTRQLVSRSIFSPRPFVRNGHGFNDQAQPLRSIVRAVPSEGGASEGTPSTDDAIAGSEAVVAAAGDGADAGAACSAAAAAAVAAAAGSGSSGSSAASTTVPPAGLPFGHYVRALSSAADAAEALALLAAMRLDGHEPTTFQYASAIRACNEDGEWQASLALLGEMRTEAVPVNAAVYSGCLEACAAGGRHVEAWQLLERMREEKSAALDAVSE